MVCVSAGFVFPGLSGGKRDADSIQAQAETENMGYSNGCVEAEFPRTNKFHQNAAAKARHFYAVTYGTTSPWGFKQ
jgi:hypothetical protein